MDISSISSSQLATEQSVSTIKSQSSKSETAGGSETVTAFGDTVEISEEGLVYSVQATAESDTAEMEMETEDAGAASETEATAGATGTATSSSDDEDDIEELEAQISALRKEITALMAKAGNDETAKAAQSAKQAEMLGLQSELMQLISQT